MFHGPTGTRRGRAKRRLILARSFSLRAVTSLPIDWTTMVKPLIGMTCHAMHEPFLRSAVNQQYVEAISGAGGAIICIPLGLDEESLDRIYGLLDGLLLPGGDDVNPVRYGHEIQPMLSNFDDLRDELELSLTRRALRDNLPLLGICRGIQLLTVAAGGTLYQDIPSQIERYLRHDIREFGRDY